MNSSLLTEVTQWREHHPLVLFLRESGMTQTDLAVLLGVTRSAVGQWLTGGKMREEYIAQMEKLDKGFADKLAVWRDESPLKRK
jgi:predicted transcriptional regulator